MEYDDVYKFICENLDQGLNSAQCEEIKRHLENCPECKAYLDSLKRTISLYRAEPVPHIPQEVHQRLFKALESVTAQNKKRKAAGKKKKCT